MKTYRIALVPGDGIGKEVVPAGRQVLEALAAAESDFSFEFENFGWGGDYYRKHGEMMPADGLDALREQGRDPVRLGRRSAHSRPHHAVGPAPEDLPGPRPVRQRAADAHSARHRRAAEALQAGRPELGDRARELRGRILRRRRPRAPGIPDRSGDRRIGDDARGRRAHSALRLQAGTVAAAQAAHGGDQEQRAAPRDGDVGRDRDAGREGVPRREVGQGDWSTPPPRAW